ncbi:MAG: glycosyl transferase group 1 [Deltaproteobacteria bacterium]|nr:MAG: glycosyl transferase group 1 [Deltaproteobacteria bacterium]
MQERCMNQTILLHSLLNDQGGAARVSQLLQNSCRQAERGVRRTCEVADRSDETTQVIAPESVGQERRAGEILHIHSTASWADLLQGCQHNPSRTVITLHDTRLLTDGHLFLGTYAASHAEDGDISRQQCAPAGTGSVANLLQGVRPLLVAPSRWMAGMAREVFPDLNVAIVPNGVPWPAASKTLGHRVVSGGPIVLFVAHGGQQAHIKGGDSWQALWECIKANIPLCKGFFVGGERTEHQGDITILPYLPSHALASLMAKATLLVYPTRADNHPLVVLEAMAQKLPCIAFDVGGIPEQIRDGETGVLVRAGDEHDFVEQTIALLRSPSRCRRLGETAFQTGRQRFSLERMGAGYERIYARMEQEGEVRCDDRGSS